MTLSHVPDFILIQRANKLDRFFIPNNEYSEYDYELDARQPPDHFYFGDCADKPVFLPIEPVQDGYGNVIFSEIVGTDDEVIEYAV